MEAAARDQAESLPAVNITRVRRSPPFTGLLLPGTIAPLTEAYLYARATGYIKKRYADIGDRVHEGQVLAEIDAPDLDLEVAQARAMLAQSEQQLAQSKASLENAQAQEELARVTWERYRVLVQHGAVSRQDADQQLANYRAERPTCTCRKPPCTLRRRTCAPIAPTSTGRSRCNHSRRSARPLAA